MIGYLLKRPVAVGMLYMALIILGVFSYLNLAIEGQPETELPQLVVRTGWSSTSPEVVQIFLTTPIEEAAAQLEGLEEMESSSTRGSSEVILRFSRETDMDFAKIDLNERISKLRSELPDGASQPTISMIESDRRVNEAFMSAAVTGPYELEQLTEVFRDYLVSEISGVDGVAEVEIRGEREKAVRIRLDREALDLYKLVPTNVTNAVNDLTERYETSRSTWDNREYTITLKDSIPSIEELENLIVARLGDEMVRVRDVGMVELGHAKAMSYSRLNGNPVISVNLEKEVGANVIKTSQQVRQRTQEVLEEINLDLRVDWISDQGEMMGEQLDSVYERAIWCIVLIVILLLFFLHSFSAALVITLNILFSVLITINFMYYFQVSFNVVTLSGLAVGFGMLVDNAIVVLENIFRHRELGESRFEAARKGAVEVMWAIFAATSTTVAAFLCMVFLEDRLAVTYWPLALAVIFSLSASLVVSFTFTPLLSMMIPEKTVHAEKESPWPIRMLVHVLDKCRHYYGQAVHFSLNHKLFVLAFVGAFTFMFTYIFIYELDKGGFTFWASPNDAIGVVVRMPEGADLETANDVIGQFEQPLLEVEGYKDLDVQVYSNFAHMRVTFEDDMLETAFPLALKSRMISIAQGFAGVGLTVYGINNEDNYYSGSTGYETYNSSIRLLGYNYKRLMDYAREIEKTVKRQRRVKSTKLETSRRGYWGSREQTETVLNINRDALRRYDISVIYLMGFLMRNLETEQRVFTKYQGEEVRLDVKFEDAERFDIKDLEGLVVKTENGQNIRLADLVTLEERTVPSGIDRKDQQFMVNVRWDYKGSAKRARNYNESIFNSLQLPAGFKAELDYDQFLSEDENENLRFVIILAAIIVFMIIAALYESFVDPLVIFTTIPLSLVGVSWIYWYNGNSFDSTAYVGLIILAGIVVNNSILLVSHINHEVSHMHESGLDFQGAVVKACQDRLRPILLTAITTVVGLLPLLDEFVTWFMNFAPVAFLMQLDVVQGLMLKLTGSAEATSGVNTSLQTTLAMFSSLSRTTVGGLISATFSTLFIIPVIYTVFYRGKQWLNDRINEVFFLSKGKTQQLDEQEGPATA